MLGIPYELRILLAGDGTIPRQFFTHDLTSIELSAKERGSMLFTIAASWCCLTNAVFYCAATQPYSNALKLVDDSNCMFSLQEAEFVLA